MDAPELSRWTRFAAKGGIGKCSAAQDCVAEKPDDLMFLEVCPWKLPVIDYYTESRSYRVTRLSC
jgi:hypothetical protein